MNLTEILAWIALALAAIPAVLFVVNCFAYRRITAGAGQRGEGISVLIPARNEARNVGATLESVLSNGYPDFEVVVLDDHSTDGTAQIVQEFAAKDARVRWEKSPELPAGWCGKQHACQVLSGLARKPLLLFVDADVRLSSDALSRLSGLMATNPAALVSGVPRQEYGTFLEKLLLPLIQFVLLGYLPIPWGRRNLSPAFAAGCGQLMLARAEVYRAAGGHAAIRASLHDGVKLPRAFRQAGFHTDLFDATDVAVCRMYRSNAEVWQGLGKNATEGLGAPGTIGPMSVLLLGGHALPVLALLLSWMFTSGQVWIAAAAVGLSYFPRLIAAWKFQQPLSLVVLHPVGVTVLMAIQWVALVRSWRGRPSMWKGRVYGSENGARPVGAVRSQLAEKVALVLIMAAMLTGSGGLVAEECAGGVLESNALPKQIELPDQFGKPHRCEWPAEKVIILAIADAKGSEQIKPWVQVVQKRFGSSVAIEGIADVSAVPAALRSYVRSRIAKKFSYSIMLDWEGAVMKGLPLKKDVVNVVVVDRSGAVRLVTSGLPEDGRLEEVGEAVQKATVRLSDSKR